MSDSSFWPPAADWRLFATSLVAAAVGFGTWFLAVELLGWLPTSSAWLIVVFAVAVFAAIQFGTGYRSAQ